MGDPVQGVLSALLTHGTVGLLAAFLGWLYLKERAALIAEKDARIKDAKDVLELVMKVQSDIHEDVGILAKVGERLDKVMSERRSRSGY